MNTEKLSFVHWFPDLEQHKCGYCKSKTGSTSYGMWARQLNVEDYQNLIDRGWRRSGKYCYKPVMTQTCCPQYTIRCDALDLALSKSQKKTIKKFNKFLNDGILAPNNGPSNEMECDNFKESQSTRCDPSSNSENVSLPLNHESPVEGGVEKAEEVAVQETTEHETKTPVLPEVLTETPSKKKDYKTGEGADPNKPVCKKAKLLRLEKRQNKQTGQSSQQKSIQNNQGKSLEEVLACDSDKLKHKLSIKLVKTSGKTGQDWEDTKLIEYELYKKYQITVHNDKPDELSMDGFVHFLVDSPLKDKPFNVSKNGCGYGSFHQQYWLDGVLIAVGVIDILVNCVSSVYFFYDPEYRGLTLGTYGSMRELEFTRQLNKQEPSITHYYMGFYIHSCVKMKYKGKIKPSFLLCPETYAWFPIESALPKLDANKYSRLNDDIDALDNNSCTTQNIDDIKIYYNGKFTLFKYFKSIYGNEDVFRNVGLLVGKKCLSSIVFIET